MLCFVRVNPAAEYVVQEFELAILSGMTFFFCTSYSILMTGFKIRPSYGKMFAFTAERQRLYFNNYLTVVLNMLQLRQPYTTLS